MAKKKEYYKINQKTIGVAVVVIIILAILIGLYFKGGFGMQPTEDTKEEIKEETQEEGPAPEFELIVVYNEDCKECMNVTEAAQIIKDAPTLKITSDKIISFESKEGDALIKKYEINKLPAFILKGENLEADLPLFEKTEDALVFKDSPPVYYDIEEDRIIGEVNVILLTKPDCEECFNIKELVSTLDALGLAIIDSEEIEYDSKEGEALIDEYEITKIPTMILSEDAGAYDMIKQAWESVGTIEEDGKLVLRTLNPPYYDLDAKRVKGLVDLIMLKDDSCDECFSVKELKTMFEQSAKMVFDSVKTYDVSSTKGKELIEEFNITLVPTVILSKEAKEYESVIQMWPQIGKEVDGNYVLTELDLLKDKVYKDLSTGEIKGLPEEPAAEAEPEEAPEEESEEINVPDEIVEE